MEGFPSGQRGQTVNLLAQPSKVRILLPPPFLFTLIGQIKFSRGHRIVAITSAFQADDAGSIPAARSSVADIAQLVEHTLGKGEVGGSTPPISTIFSIFIFLILVL